MNVKKLLINIILVIILMISLSYIIFYIYSFIHEKDVINDLETVVIDSIDVDDKQNEDKQTIQYINFDKLMEINSDVVGWIKIEKIDVSYPILQTDNNEYYLKNDIYHKKSISGSIFMDYRNSNWNDYQVILYGHNMQTGTMFGRIDEILDNKLGEEIEIIIETREKIYKYLVFSAYMTDPIYSEITQDYESLLSKSLHNFNVNNVDESNNILTLVTCNNTSVRREIVHSILISETNKMIQ